MSEIEKSMSNRVECGLLKERKREGVVSTINLLTSYFPREIDRLSSGGGVLRVMPYM